MTSSRRSLFAHAAAWLAALAVAACGGGVETGGTGPTGSSFVEGPVNGFGSVIVAGIRFDESGATIQDADGTPRDRSELRLGMRVEIAGGAVADDSDGGRSARADRVRIVAELLAPVTAVEAGGALIEVLGQAVRINAATVIDGVAGGVAALRIGDVVEVHGFVDPGLLFDRYVATRVERRSAALAAYRVRGLVRELDTAARTMRIGSQSFDLSAVGLPAGLANGRVVRLVVGTSMTNGRWPVSAITVVSRAPPDSDEAQIEGLVTALSSVTRFDVNGLAVDASTASFVNGTAGIVLGARVKVRGRAAGGVLVADRVELRSEGDVFNEGVDLRDLIASLDTVAQTFSVRGVTVFYGASPRYDNGTVADLANGRRVRVRATLAPDRTRLVATRIEFVNN
jgi:Domain of unknown function (DUF5666)